MKYELKALGVEEVCITCQHFRTIEVNKLYRCMKYAFRQVVDDKCPEKQPWANARRDK
jgi:hypothetical protein